MSSEEHDDLSDLQETGNSSMDDANLPAKGINALIKDNLGNSIRVSNEARDQFHQVCVLFVKHITRKSAHASGSGQRKTILYEHVQQALESCDLSYLLQPSTPGPTPTTPSLTGVDASFAHSNPPFGAMPTPVGAVPKSDPGLDRVLHQCRERAARRTKRRRSRLEHMGVDEGELLRQQQQLIREAMLQHEADQAAELAAWNQQQEQLNLQQQINDPECQGEMPSTSGNGAAPEGVQGAAQNEMKDTEAELDEDYDAE